MRITSLTFQLCVVNSNPCMVAWSMLKTDSVWWKAPQGNLEKCSSHSEILLLHESCDKVPRPKCLLILVVSILVLEWKSCFRIDACLRWIKTILMIRNFIWNLSYTRGRLYTSWEYMSIKIQVMNMQLHYNSHTSFMWRFAIRNNFLNTTLLFSVHVPLYIWNTS